MENIIGDALIAAVYMCPILLVLGLCAAFADRVLPRCPRLLRFLGWLCQTDLGGNGE